MKELQSIIYPGRFIILGKNKDSRVAIYVAMGRNPSSKQRIYELKGNTIVAKQIKSGGNIDLLEYTAMKFEGENIIISNGKQGNLVCINSTKTAQDTLLHCLRNTSPEPDKYMTPRITGLVADNNMALHITRSTEEKTERDSWEINPKDGEGYYLPTYSGQDIRPTPSFSAEPVKISISTDTAEETAQEIHKLFHPQEQCDDYRVSVIAVHKKLGEDFDISIINNFRNDIK